jgi:hypothetical protein
MSSQPPTIIIPDNNHPYVEYGTRPVWSDFSLLPCMYMYRQSPLSTYLSSQVKSGEEGVREMTSNISQGAGGHVDITPFMALLTMDTPGLQVP